MFCFTLLIIFFFSLFNFFWQTNKIPSIQSKPLVHFNIRVFQLKSNTAYWWDLYRLHFKLCANTLNKLFFLSNGALKWKIIQNTKKNQKHFSVLFFFVSYETRNISIDKYKLACPHFFEGELRETLRILFNASVFVYLSFIFSVQFNYSYRDVFHVDIDRRFLLSEAMTL